MKILTDFDGANIIVLEENQNSYVIEPDMRDTNCDWFYWAFGAEGEKGETVTFTFKKPVRIGRFGPCVSYDLINWHWLGSGDDMSFSYTFEERKMVYFAHNILCDTESFSKTNIPTNTLCISKKGRKIPYAEFGEGENTVLLTARHHCCESSGGYVLEGAAMELYKSLPPDMSVIVVPYIDYDGVKDGDQGKNRIPHDHNRDYTENPIYNSVRAVMELTKNKKIVYAIDFHSPYYQGGRRDYPFIVHANKSEETVCFSCILEKETECLPIPYTKNHDVLYGMEWNKESDKVEKFSSYFLQRRENKLSFTIENPYFGTEEYAVCKEYFHSFGKCVAVALKKYHKGE